MDFRFGSQMVHVPTYSIVSLSVGLLVVFIYWAGLPRPIPGIPYNKESARRWLGDVPSFLDYVKRTGEGWEWIALQCEQLDSPIVQVFLGPFQKPTVILADQQELREIITKRTKEFDRGGFMTRWLGIIIPEGTISMPTHARFKAQRAVWQGTMTADFINNVSAPEMHAHTTTLVKVWRAKAEKAQGRAFEANNDLRLTVFEIIWSVTFGRDMLIMRDQLSHLTQGHSIPTLTQEEARFNIPVVPEIFTAITHLLDTLDKARSSPFPMIHRAILRRTSKFKNVIRVKHSNMRALLHESKAKFNDENRAAQRVTCAMDHVYKRQAASAGKMIQQTDEEMEDELSSFIVGGHESTQHNASWGIKYLSQSPEAQRRLHEELKAAFPESKGSDRLPPIADIIGARLPYLDACIEEILRLARTNAGALRLTTRDTTIYDYKIPKGTNLFGAHTAESVVLELPPVPAGYEMTSKRRHPWAPSTMRTFDPSRWLTITDDPEKGQQITFDNSAGPSLPFGAGLRGCFGQRLARTNLRVMFIMLVLSFEFEPVEGEMGSFRAEEKLVRGAKYCHVKLKIR